MTTTTTTTTTTTNTATIDKCFDTPFSNEYASSSLRVTVYGSSSAKTPAKYLTAARGVGYMLAKRGHICVNGAGQFGCMAAMNEGVELGNGSVVGVIHEMFLVDNGYWQTSSSSWTSSTSSSSESNDNAANNNKKKTRTVVMRDGGKHGVFANATTKRKDEPLSTIAKPGQNQAPIREILVAGGDDLQERKKLLVRGTDALIVLPGGPGTWDELWEMACARHLNLNQLPIVCVNVDGFYEPFRTMLDKAWEDELIKLPPDDIIHFAPTAEEAVQWIEMETERMNNGAGDTTITATTSSSSRRTSNQTFTRSNRNKSLLSRTSFFSVSPYLSQGKSLFSWSSTVSDGNDDNHDHDNDVISNKTTSSTITWNDKDILTFLAGVSLGGLAVIASLHKKYVN